MKIYCLDRSDYERLSLFSIDYALMKDTHTVSPKKTILSDI